LVPDSHSTEPAVPSAAQARTEIIAAAAAAASTAAMTMPRFINAALRVGS
jgi:hypothetical protein